MKLEKDRRVVSQWLREVAKHILKEKRKYWIFAERRKKKRRIGFI